MLEATNQPKELLLAKWQTVGVHQIEADTCTSLPDQKWKGVIYLKVVSNTWASANFMGESCAGSSIIRGQIENLFFHIADEKVERLEARTKIN